MHNYSVELTAINHHQGQEISRIKESDISMNKSIQSNSKHIKKKQKAPFPPPP